MSGEALQHWLAYEATADVMKIASPSATEQEKSDQFGRIYDRLRQALAEFQQRTNRLQRLVPRWWN